MRKTHLLLLLLKTFFQTGKTYRYQLSVFSCLLCFLVINIKYKMYPVYSCTLHITLTPNRSLYQFGSNGLWYDS